MLDAQDGSLAFDAVKDASVVDGNVLLRDDLDDFLRHHTSGQGSDVVEFRRACTDAVIHMLASDQRGC